jgi:hypothetical protein
MALMSVKKIVSIVLLVVGIIVLILSLTANVSGIGPNPTFGYLQILGSLAGAIMAVVGLVLILRK